MAHRQGPSSQPGSFAITAHVTNSTGTGLRLGGVDPRHSLSAAFAAGCDAFDAKPIQFERLLATLRRLGRAARDTILGDAPPYRLSLS
jgi:CheY-like chemotaxis protein